MIVAFSGQTYLLVAVSCFVAVFRISSSGCYGFGLLSGNLALSGHAHLFLFEYGVAESVPLSHEIKVYHQNKDKFEQ